MIHIGERIRQQLEHDGRSITWFAERICCSRANVYKIFERHSIDTQLLLRISAVLNHDFFADFSTDLGEGGDFD